MRVVIKKLLYFLFAVYNYLKFYCFHLKKITQAEIVFFFPYYHTGGAERVHLSILQALNPQKCCVIFTHLSATKNFYDQFNQVASIIEINAIRNKKSIFFNNILRKNIYNKINNGKTVKAVFGCNTNYYYEILPYFSNSIKKIDLIHALEPNDERKKMLIESTNLLDVRVVINENAKKDIIEIYKEGYIKLDYVDRIKIIENGVFIDKNDFIDFKSKDYEKISIGFLGRWSAEKRPQIYLEVAKKIKKQFPNVDFLMAGTGMMSNLEQITVSGSVFLGEITDEIELKKLYKKLNFIIITSVNEGFPMVIMESMIHGAIPVCTNVGGIHEHIINMENGILINDTNEEELIEAFTSKISYLIKNIDVAKKLSDNAFNYSVENFSIEKFSRSYQKLFSL